MNRDEIISMAREDGFVTHRDEWAFVERLERFASLIASAEREACAKVVDGNIAASTPGSRLNDILMSNAAAIRARGQA